MWFHSSVLAIFNNREIIVLADWFVNLLVGYFIQRREKKRFFFMDESVRTSKQSQLRIAVLAQSKHEKKALDLENLYF